MALPPPVLGGLYTVSNLIHLLTKFRSAVILLYRTGLNTTMGSMVRELLAPTKTAAQPDSFLAVSLSCCDACILIFG